MIGDMKKEVIILRSVSGAGKSTFANLLARAYDKPVICEADQFFVNEDGEYNFDVAKLGDAHAWCRQTFVNALQNSNVDGIVVANTNTSEKEFRFYESTAKELNIPVFFVVLENRHGNKDIHGVPLETLERQENKLKESLKFR